MYKVKQAWVDAAFNKLADIHNQLDEARRLVRDNFWGTSFERDFLVENAEKFGDLWKSVVMVNGSEPHDNYSMWQFYPHYNGTGRKYIDGKYYDLKGNVILDWEKFLLDNSETEKVLFKNKSIRISLVRKSVIPPTNTYYGYRLSKPIFVLFDNKNNVLYEDDKDWRFKLTITNGYNKPTATDLYSKFANNQPFKIKIIPFSNKEEIAKYRLLLSFSYWQFDYYYKALPNVEDLSVCFILGYDNNRDRHDVCTWFFVNTKDVTNRNDIFRNIIDIVDKYNFADTVEFLMNEKAIYKTDLNQLDLGVEDRFRYLVYEKFTNKIEKIFKMKYDKFKKIVLESK
jgi:hypothetical protein